MKRTLQFILAALVAISIFACVAEAGKMDRQPAVAGQFYPLNPAELRNAVAGYLSQIEDNDIQGTVRALIVPHAGYVYSGGVAAAAYAQLDPEAEYERIFILSASHTTGFNGAVAYTAGNYSTPLGIVEVDTKLCRELTAGKQGFLDRPSVHDGDHAIEVQLPFLQVRLKKKFKIVPIFVGTEDTRVCSRLADALAPYFKPGNLFIISSDFSHYPAYDDARTVDNATLDAIRKNSPEEFVRTVVSSMRKEVDGLATSACGGSAILSLLMMTSKDDTISITPLAYKNSGDISGDRSRVVGYHSIVFSDGGKGGTVEDESFRLDKKEKEALLKIARATIREAVSGGTYKPDVAALPEKLKTECGAFVTLHKDGQLRGCIGQFTADGPLYLVVRDMAISSAMRDPRFTPVTKKEIESLVIEISVLSPLKRIKSINDFKLGRDGIYIRKGHRSGTFLPQVAEETGWTVEEFLGHCSQDKAGLGWEGWKDAELYTYTAEVFR